MGGLARGAEEGGWGGGSLRYSVRCVIMREGSTKKAARDVNDEPTKVEAGVWPWGMGEESDLQAGRCVFGGLPFFAGSGESASQRISESARQRVSEPASQRGCGGGGGD